MSCNPNTKSGKFDQDNIVSNIGVRYVVYYEYLKKKKISDCKNHFATFVTQIPMLFNCDNSSITSVTFVGNEIKLSKTNLHF